MLQLKQNIISPNVKHGNTNNTGIIIIEKKIEEKKATITKDENKNYSSNSKCKSKSEASNKKANTNVNFLIEKNEKDDK